MINIILSINKRNENFIKEAKLMTIGEKIQELRKNLGLSQEELGEKLSVSMQTIDMWEKGQETPAIENLIRLKEIFDVSADEILDAESGGKTESAEAYEFSFSRTEIDEIYKLQISPLYKNLIKNILIWSIFLLFCILFSAPYFVSGFCFSVLLISLFSHIKYISNYKKVWKTASDKIFSSVYKYKIFSDHLLITIYRNNEKVRESKCHFTDIEQIRPAGNFLFMQFGGQLFTIRKSDLKENSFFYTYMYNHPTELMRQTIPNKLKIPSEILFIASLFSLLCALVLVNAASTVNGLFTENMWLFFLFTPISIALTVFGFILKSKGYKYKKYLITGIVVTIFLCVYGSFTFMFL